MKTHTLFARLLVVLVPLFLLACDDDPSEVQQTVCPSGSECLTILHTNDMHSHLLGAPNADYTPFTTNDDDTIGGVARIATKVKEIRTSRGLEGIPVLLLDAGDFTMGTLFHMLQGEAEMGIMNLLGYDATTLGNHEFDWLPQGAADIVGNADGLPVDATNLEITDPSDPGAQALQALIDAGAILPFHVQTLSNGLKVGMFGLLGENAAKVVFRPDAEHYPLNFGDMVTASNNTVQYLRNTEGVDLVICISHAGVDEPVHSQGEDPDLAAAVPGIDVIISGHTHTNMPQYVTIGKTVIVQAYCYTRRLGILDLKMAEGGGVEVLNYDYVTIDDSIPGDSETQALVQQYIDKLDQEVLEPKGYAFNQQIAETDFDLKKVYREEHNLGNLVTDAIRWSIDQVQYDPSDPSTQPVAFSVESNGVIRDAILAGMTGRINTSDAFRAVPLGIDPVSGTGGYPLVSFYLTGAEVHSALLVNALAPILNDSDYWLSWSGLQFTYAPFLILSVTQCPDPDDPTCAGGTPVPNDPGVLYKVGVNYYVATNIANVEELSYGLIKIVPKDQYGVPLASLDDAIVYKSPGVPLTEWEGFLDFLSHLPDTDGDGIPNIPARYAGPEGRMVNVCFVATAAYGTPYEGKIDVLREFRDEVLSKSSLGRKFIQFYYAHGAALAEPVARSEWLRALVRIFLLPVLGLAKLLLWIL